MDLLGIPEGMLPAVKNSSEIYGETKMGVTMGEEEGTKVLFQELPEISRRHCLVRPVLTVEK